jgi:LPXTG-motif cell wall-anchored protein
VWVVLAHTDHTPFSPNVQDQVSFVIGGGAQSATPGAPAQLPTTGESPSWLILAAIAAASVLVAGGAVLARRTQGRS